TPRPSREFPPVHHSHHPTTTRTTRTIRIIRTTRTRGDRMSRIVDFGHDDATRLDVSGGKGASLAKSARDLPVPPGIIVTAEAYSAVLAPLRRQIRGILRENTTEEASAQVQQLLLDMDLEDGWIEEIDAALHRAGLADHAVAVRSSGT